MQFEFPLYLLTLLLAPLLVVLYRYVVQWKAETAKRIGDQRLVATLIRNYAPEKFRLKFMLFFLAFLLTGIGLANLQIEEKGTPATRKGIDIIVALDVSRSMLATDVQPNRLQRAKIFIRELISQRPDDRIGLLLFAGHAYLQMPITGDHTAMPMYVQSASPSSVPTQGTAIAEALQTAGIAFDKNLKKYKAIVLITDGEDHEAEVDAVAKKLVAEGVALFSIGVGTANGQTLLDQETGQAITDNEGAPVQSRLNESLLRELAKRSGGTFQLLNEVNTVAANLSSSLDGLEKRSIRDRSEIRYTSYFPLFIGLALFLLIVELFIPERRKVA